MGCGSCSSGSCSSDGCGRNGGCATGGCNKLNTFDWLDNMLPPGHTEVDNVYEIRFKNTRKAFYRNVNGLRLYIGDNVVVESDRGYDVGILSLGGVMAELQMKKKGNKKPIKELPRIYRKANEEDLELLKEVRAKEQATLTRSRELILELKLDMKLSDVEFQGDGAKAIFYYIADHRVDFRELIKVLAREFRIRIEMKQIGLRYEAGLVGGIGACGRELCCSTWLTDFKTVSTSAARYQNLSLNPMKISGLCGRLKCCLNYELDVYIDALEGFPEVNFIETAKGKATLQKTDIFKRKMWFSYVGENSWYPMDVEEVSRIKAMNEKGEKPQANFAKEESSIDSERPDLNLDFVDVVGTNIPRPEKSRRRKPNKNKRNFKNKGRDNQQKRKPKPNTPEAKKSNTPRDNKDKGKQQKNRPNRQPNKQKGQRPKNKRGPAKGQNPKNDANKK
ncbi:MAG: regulatory iron-sulfur-containing complex subunit RicT [Bacteroidota bacterium]